MTQGSDTHQVHTPSSRYRFIFDKRSQLLTGYVEARSPSNGGLGAPPVTPVTLRTLQQHLEHEGYAGFEFQHNALKLFLKKIQRYETGSYPLAERKDAKLSISVSSDRMHARAQTEPAWGGQEITSEILRAKLKKAKIHSDLLDKSALKQLLLTKEACDVVIAKGQAPVQGKAAELEPLVGSVRNQQHDIDQKTAIDVRDVFEFIVVEPNTPLMRRHPPHAGTDGFDVLGKKISAKTGADIQFAKPFEGVEPSINDENLLVASIKGHPVLRPNSIKVDAIMQLDAVDIHSGDVEYDGSIFIKGNIEAGFKVNVSGDIFVKGSVTKATLVAGGSIEINGGVNADDIDDDSSCHLKAQENIAAKFIQHTVVECAGDLTIHEYLIQCNAVVGGSVYAGQERGRGCIIGGFTQANQAVYAKALGSDAYIATHIQLGDNGDKWRAAIIVQQKLQRRQKELEQLENILVMIRSKGSPTHIGGTLLDKARKIEKTIKTVKENIAKLEAAHALQSDISELEDLYVRVSKTVFSNTKVSIVDKHWLCETTRKSCKIGLSNNRVKPGVFE